MIIIVSLSEWYVNIINLKALNVTILVSSCIICVMAKGSKTHEKVSVQVREAFQSLLKEHVQTKGERLKLAKTLGVSESAIKAMLYLGKGGLETWIEALNVYYPIQDKLLKELPELLKAKYSSSESDRLWKEIKLTEKEKIKLAKIATFIAGQM